MDIHPNPGPISTISPLDMSSSHSMAVGNLNSSVPLVSCNIPSSRIVYSFTDLFKIRNCSFISTPNCCSLLKELNIFRFRGKRGGRSRRCEKFVKPVNPSNPELNSSPIVNNFVRFCLLNTRSLNNKSLQVNDYIIERNLDIMAVTETWLNNSPDSNFVTRDVCPTGYLISHVPRNNRSGGGVAVIYRSSFNANLCDSVIFNSFESMEMTFRSRDQTIRVVVVYRPPSLSHNLFYDEFSSFLETLVLLPGKLFICGDFNIHVDNKNDCNTQRFLDLLDCFSLHCFDSTSSTHKLGHALDLLITRSDEDLISNFFLHDPVISDHLAVHCLLSFVKPASKTRTVSYRKIRSVDLVAFRKDIANSLLCTSSVPDLSDLCLQYDSVLSNIVNQHAPLCTKTVSDRPRAPWYNDVIRKNKTIMRKLERRWRKTNLTIDRELYVAQCTLVKDLIFSAKMSYYSKLIDESDCDNKVLFSTVDKLLHRSAEIKQPSSPSPEVLANTFVHFFNDKIINIRNELSQRTPSHPADAFVEFDCPQLDCSLDSFLPVSPDELSVMCKKLLSK